MISVEENCMICVCPTKVARTKRNIKNATNMKNITRGEEGGGKEIRKNVLWLKSA